jgi:hypothetical protein
MIKPVLFGDLPTAHSPLCVCLRAGKSLTGRRRLENLVLSKAFDLKIMDFGSVKFRDQMQTVVDTQGVTRSVTSTFADVGTVGNHLKAHA